MTDKEVFKMISTILDEWDPIGVNDPSKGIYYGEYVMYIDKIIEKYKKGESIYDYLIQLYSELVDDPNDEGIDDTKTAAKRIIQFLDLKKGAI